MKIQTLLGLLVAAALAATMAGQPAAAQDEKPIRIGIVTFLSGGAAGPFGIPARNAAEITVEALNAGTIPAPYHKKGIGGRPIETVIIDEAGGTTKQVTEYRNLVQLHQVDLVIGYISSGDCLAIAPLADELKKLTVFFDCGTPRIFEDAKYTYLFRTGPTATMDSVGAALYVLHRNPKVATVAGINQNYAWGQDSWTDFRASMTVLKPEIKVGTEQFPKLYAGAYSSEISALQVANADVIHSSFWGGDMEAFVLQGAARGLFANRAVVLTTGETGMFRLGRQMPDGTILGGRGPHGVFAPDNALNKWFRPLYEQRYQTPPTYPSYKMVVAFLGVKAAYEKAMAGAGGHPTDEQVTAAFSSLEYDSPSGKVSMVLGEGHQAVQETAYGVFKYDAEKGATITEIVRYPAECVNPPNGVKSEEWIKGGFKGAKC
jgi:branched-chain amino acid transport system substrate-binding protein